MEELVRLVVLGLLVVYSLLSLSSSLPGLHAPFRLLMERKAASQVSRLPFLPSHHVALDVLTGNDECVAFEDFLGGQEVGSEVMGNPHALVEKRMGIL